MEKKAAAAVFIFIMVFPPSELSDKQFFTRRMKNSRELLFFCSLTCRLYIWPLTNQRASHCCISYVKDEIALSSHF